MRITVAVVLLLLSAEVVHGQTVTAIAAPVLPSSVQVPPSTLPTFQPIAAPTTPVTAQSAAESPKTARAQVAATGALAEAQEPPRKRSRVLWILVGVVTVLAIIVVAR